jgi:serine/threonine protein kinase/WD40 repeat protein
VTDDTRSSVDESSTEALLADLCEEISSRVRQGELVDLNEYLECWPQYTQELTEAFETIQWMAQLKSPSNTDGSTASYRLREGETLGDYSLVRVAGRGGMGIVYEAEQASLKRRVALKVLPFASVLDPLRLKRFENEVQAAALLNHPHIVPIYGVGEDRGIHFFSMKWIDGPSLADVIYQMKSRELGSMTVTGSARTDSGPQGTQPSSLASCTSHRTQSYVRSAAQVIADVAEALDHAHRQGIVHRDIKPGNLLMDSRGHIWITDFGLVRMENDATLTATGDLIGTLRYMSPEQAEGSRDIIDHRCDIYSLGATLYELLTLQPIFPEERREKLLRQVLTQEPTQPRSVEPSIPIDLETILIKSLAKRPEDRYATAQAMADDLRCWLEHRPITARRPSLADRTSKWMLRNQRAVFAGMMGMTLMLVTLSIAIGLIWEEQRKTSEALAQAEEREKARIQAEAKALAAERQEHRESYRRMLQSLEYLQASQQFHQVTKTLHAIKASKMEDAMRGLEWRMHWYQFVHSPYRVYSEYDKAIDRVESSADGRRIATLTERSVRVWDSATGEMLAEIHDPESRIQEIHLSPDGGELLTAALNRLRVWDLATGEPIGDLTGLELSIPDVHLYQDEKRIAASEFLGRSLLIDSESLKIIAEKKTHDYPGDPNLTLVWDPTHPRVAALKTKCGFFVADFEREGRHVTPYEGPPLLRGAFVPGEEKLVVIDTEGLVTWRSIETGVVHRKLSLPTENLLSADFDSDLKYCVTVDPRGNVALYSLLDGQCLFMRESAQTNTVRWLGTTRRIALVGSSGMIAVWEPFSQIPPDPIGHEAETWSVVYSPDGKWLASGGDDHAVKLSLVSDPATQRILSGHEALVAAVAFSPDGKTLASASYDGTVRLWSVEDGNCIRTLNQHSKRVCALRFNHDGSRLAAGGDDLIVWDPRQGTVVQNFDARRRGRVHQMTFTKDEKYLIVAVSNFTNSIELWDLSKGAIVRKFDTVTECCALDVSNDGKLLIAGDVQGNVTFFRFPEGQPLKTLSPHIGYVRAVRLSHDQTRLLTAGDDGNVMAWDMESQTPLCNLGTMESAVYSLDIAPGDSEIAVGCYDGSIHVMRTTSAP